MQRLAVNPFYSLQKILTWEELFFFQMEDYNPEHFRTKTRGNDTRKERGSEVHKSAAFSMPQSVPYILEHATRCAQGKKTY